MKTVIILGAGISRAASGNNKPVKDTPPLDADFFQIAKASNRKKFDEVDNTLQELVGDYKHTLQASLEASAAYLYLKAIDSPSGSSYHKGFLNLLYLLNFVLAKTTNSTSLGPRSLLYRFLLAEIRKLDDPESLSIITFNYDLLAEKTLDEIATKNSSDIFSFPGCYRLPNTNMSTIENYASFKNINKEHKGVKVLKLHGSLNWQSKHTSAEPNPSALFSPTRAIHIMNSPKIPTSLTWKPKKRLVYMKPIIVPPVSGKRNMMHNSMTSLWKMAATALQEADRIIIAGYSCPPLDLEARILLSENLRLNKSKKLYVIDPNPQSAAKFIEICGVDHATIYTSIQDWVRDSIK